MGSSAISGDGPDGSANISGNTTGSGSMSSFVQSILPPGVGSSGSNGTVSYPIELVSEMISLLIRIKSLAASDCPDCGSLSVRRLDVSLTPPKTNSSGGIGLRVMS